MTLSRLLPLALRNLSRNRVRSLLVGGTLALGALVLFTSLFLADGIDEGITETLVAVQSGAVLVRYDGDDQAAIDAFADPEAFTALDDEVRGRLAGLDDLESRRRFVFDGLLLNDRGRSMRLGIRAVATEDEGALRDYLRTDEGVFLEPPPDGEPALDQVLVSRTVADELSVGAGDLLTLVVNTWGEAINAYDLEVVGIFESLAPWVDYTGYVPMDVAERLYDATVANEYLLDPRGEHDLAAAPILAERVRATLAGLPVRVEDYATAGGMQLGIARANRITSWSLSGMLFLVVVLGVANLMSMVVRERRREIATLAAIGFNAPRLIGLFLLEVVVLAGLAAGAALTLGGTLYVWLARSGIAIDGVARYAFGTAQLYPALHGYQIVLVLFVTFGTSVIGSLLPAWKAANRQVRAAL